MRHFKLSLGLLSLLAGVSLSLSGCGGRDADYAPAIQSSPGLSQAVAAVHARLQTALGRPVPSLSVLVQTPEGAYFATAAAAGEPAVTPDTHFRFASNTKSFTAAAVMKMHQDGWLDYRARIVDAIPGTSAPYVPEGADWAVPYKERITIRQLLQHSAGVYDVGNDPVPGCEAYEDCVLAADPDHTFAAAELVGQVARHGLSYFPPGEGYHYSNTGYTMLSEIVARVYSLHSGAPRSFADYLNDHLVGPQALVPLEVRFPDQGLDQSLPQPRACGHIVWPGERTELLCDLNISAKVAEGNGIGTLRQLNQWVRSVFGGRNVLSAESVRLMKTDVSAASPSYGLGTFHVPNLGYGHNGATHGTLSQMTYDPERQVSVVVLLPLWDFTQGSDSFLKVFSALNCAGWDARQALGHPGRPEGASCP